MKKLVIAMTLVATAAAALPANAAPRGDTAVANPSAQSTIQVGNQCFKPTDSRGYGYWDSCDNVYAFTIGRRGVRSLTVDSNGADGGGGDGGGGGGGGGR